MMQYLTNSFLKSTPHKVGLNNSERYTIAYFHEPSFQAVVKPIEDFGSSQPPFHHEAADEEGVHYGTHFTNMFMRNYPDRITTHRLIEEERYPLLATEELRTMEEL